MICPSASKHKLKVKVNANTFFVFLEFCFILKSLLMSTRAVYESGEVLNVLFNDF